MKKKILFISILALYVSLDQFCFGQIQSMGFTQPIVSPPEGAVYRPKLKLIGDTLYVCSNTGIYRKNLQDNTDWELYAFENIPVIEFVKNGDKLLAINGGTTGTDSILLLSDDNGQTFIDYTSPHFLEYGMNYISRIAQNPVNGNSILALHMNMGISKSDDFGLNWTKLADMNFGGQNWHLGFHPLDTTTIFYTGETMFFWGEIRKSSNNGETWSIYNPPGGDNCIHSMAFHPANPDIMVYSGEGVIGKSTDKGETWDVTDLYNTGMYFYKILFDEENPAVLYASGYQQQDTVWIYRSIDMGNSWELAHKEKLENCGGVWDMLLYKDKLIFYTLNSGLFELDLESITGISEIAGRNATVSVYPNPTGDYLTIVHAETDNYPFLQMYDMTGRPVGANLRVSQNNKGETTLDISHLKSGVYFLKAGSETVKVMKKQ
jgi:photosystem II stability/assembly factor-like uncharacterized protein